MINWCELLYRLLNFHSICKVPQHKVLVPVYIVSRLWRRMLLCIQVKLLHSLWWPPILWIALLGLHRLSLNRHDPRVLDPPLALVNGHLVFLNIRLSHLELLPLDPSCPRSKYLLNDYRLDNSLHLSMMGQQRSVCPHLKELVPSFPHHLDLLPSSGLEESESKHSLFSVLTLFKELRERTGVKSGYTKYISEGLMPSCAQALRDLGELRRMEVGLRCMSWFKERGSVSLKSSML